MSYETTLEASRGLKGGLGAVAFAVLEGLERGGASPDQIEAVHELIGLHFAMLSDEDCNTLCAVVAERLATDRGPSGAWY